MVAKLLTTTVAAPGFMGLNTQDSSISLEAGYATVANNCVIDKFGRIGARKGWQPSHTTNSDLGTTANVKAIGELIDNAGNSYIIAAGNNKLFKLVGTTLTTLTYGGSGTAPTITDSNWQMAPLNGVLYLYQAGHDPLVFDPTVSTTTFKRISEKTGYVATVSSNNTVISAYGRTWSANNSTAKSTIQFSDLLAGHVLSTGTAGTLDVSQVWPNGADEIISLAAHNNFLIVFGRRQILIYSNATDPNNLTLSDAITGMGCVARDSVVATGSDILFLSDSGIRSLMRTIQEKSAPMRDISSNVRDDLVLEVSLETAADIRAVYSDKEAFYLLSLPTRQLVYCFDMRSQLPNGANRVTTWDGIVPTAFKYTRNRDVLLGKAGYVGSYTGYKDNADGYFMKYYTNYFDFQAPTTIKIMKKVGVTIVGGQGYNISLRFGFDYNDIFNLRQFSLANATIAEYNIAEYNIGEYGGSVFDNKIINIGGSGKVIQLGFETTVFNKAISIQKLDVYVKTGKTR
jgi:hypothetical protein